MTELDGARPALEDRLMPPGSSLFILTTALIAAVTEPTVGGAPARDAGADTTFVIRAGRLVDVREGRWI